MSDATSSGRRFGRSASTLVRRAFITGLAVLVPLAITGAVLAAVFGYIYTALDRFSDAVFPLSPNPPLPLFGYIGRELFVELATPILLVAVVLSIGFGVHYSRYGERAVRQFDDAITQLPAVGAIYESFRRMSDVMLESDVDNFRKVVLVEFPTEGTYTLAFLTAETPASIREATGSDRMMTVFLPLAPNPVMGGHVVNVPVERVYDVDMTIEEGVQAIVTSGVALSGFDDGEAASESAAGPSLSPAELDELAAQTGFSKRSVGTGADEDRTEGEGANAIRDGSDAQ